ncbi:inter-alpha-trypsin inhibitor heavy chain H3-like isoform X2 [Anolis sagrei]|uniref:inter-alpha-trypsin inhibitor heavy chain H3-like isoform X2 n=1 Tax=Anolis sagrei TaxID=38937 RepID=UPI0035225696
MGSHLPFYIWLAFIPALVSSVFLIEQLRNIKKRNTIDEHPKGIEIYWVKIDSSVTSRFSRNVITSRAVNRANVSKEAFFDVELPKTAFITNFTMTIDGVTYPGTIKEKEVAQKQYQKAVSSGRTAGLVKASGRKTEKFSVSVNVAAASKITFELTYEELLKRNFGKYELFIKVNPKQLVNKFEIEANIFEPQGISDLEVEGTFLNNELLPLVQKSYSGKKAHVFFSPTIDQQRTCDNCTTSLLQGDFLIKYDVNRDLPSNLQIVNGYFVHFFAPKNLPRLPKNIAFIIDISGSMYGIRIQQAKEAFIKIVEDLKEDDHFNIVLFESKVHKWKDGIIKATPENVQEAKYFIGNITVTGATNFNDGLMTGIEILNNAHALKIVPERSASLTIMLSDGNANEGETDPLRIRENVKNASLGEYPLYSLGFGYGVDYAFLERVSKENNGLARRIYEDSDAALQLQGFYDEVANPLLTEVTLEYPENVISDVTENNFKHYYDGSELVVAGRITDNDLNSITAEVKAHGALNDLTFTEQISTKEIILHDGVKRTAFSWLDDVTLQEPSLTLVIKRKKSMEVSMDNGAKFVVILHQVWKKHPLHRDFLGFYTLDSHRLSQQTHGLLGQFFRPIDFDILEVHPGSDPEKPDATMVVKNNQLSVTRGWQKDYTEDTRHGLNVPCWFIHNNGEGLIDGVHTDYIVPSIFG